MGNICFLPEYKREIFVNYSDKDEVKDLITLDMFEEKETTFLVVEFEPLWDNENKSIIRYDKYIIVKETKEHDYLVSYKYFENYVKNVLKIPSGAYTGTIKKSDPRLKRRTCSRYSLLTVVKI